MTIQAITFPPTTFCVDHQTSLSEVLQLMLQHEINHVPVCNQERYIGLLSINHILCELLPISARLEHGVPDLKFAGDAKQLIMSHLKELENKSAGQIALHDVPHLDENCPLLEAMLLLSRHGTPLPVLTSDGKLHGMLSRRAILRYIVEQAGG